MVDSLADLAREAGKLSLTPPDAPEESPPDTRTWDFSISYIDRRGTVYAGQFTTSILDQGQLLQAKAIRARLMGGQAAASYDPDDLDYMDIVSHLQLALTKRPTSGVWADDKGKARDLLRFDDRGVVYALWEKVSAHNAYYFRLGASPQGG